MTHLSNIPKHKAREFLEYELGDVERFHTVLDEALKKVLDGDLEELAYLTVAFTKQMEKNPHFALLVAKSMKLYAESHLHHQEN